MADDITPVLSRLITAFHILHYKGVLDAYGHVSIRNPLDKTTFFSSSQPANLISSPADLLQWNVSDGSPVQNPVGGTRSPTRVSPFSEHFIHSSLLSKFPSLNSVVHSHSPALIACGLQKRTTYHGSKAASSEVLFPPTAHLAGFIRFQTAVVFDPRQHYDTCTLHRHSRNFLVSTKCLGDALADSLHPRTDKNGATIPIPDEGLILQSHHGFSTWDVSLEDAVYRAVYSHVNAQILINARVLGGPGVLENRDEVAIDVATAETCEEEINSGMPKAWPSWAMEAQRSGMYVNTLE